MAVSQIQQQVIDEQDDAANVVTDVKTNPVESPKSEVVTANPKRLSVEDDFNMGKDKGVFVYPQNYERFRKLTDFTNVTSAVGEALGEAGILDVEQTTPIEKKVEQEAEVAKGIADKPLDQPTFFQRIRDGQIDEVSKPELDRFLSIVENPDGYPSSVVQKAQQGLDRAQRFYESRRIDKQTEPKVDLKFEGPTGEFAPTPELKKNPEAMTEAEKQFTGQSVVLNSVKGKFSKKGFDEIQETILEDLVVQNISTGEFWDLAVERTNEGLIRGAALYLPELTLNAINGVGSVLAYGTINIATQVPFSSVVGVPEKGITLRDSWKYTEPERKAFKQSWDALIADTLGIKTVTRVYNDYFYDKLKDKLDSGEKIGGVVLDQDAFDALTTINDPKTNEPIRRDFLGEEDIFKLMSDVTQTVSEDERYLLSLAEAATIVGPTVAAKAKQAKAALVMLREDLAKVRKAKGPAADHISGMDDIAAYWALRSDKNFRSTIRSQRENDLVFAIEDEHAREGFARLQSRVNKLDDDIAMKSRDVPASDPELIQMIRERESLSFQVTRAKYFHNLPVSVLKTTAKQVVPLAYVQYQAGEYLTDMFDDRLTAEAMGSIAYLTVGKGVFKGVGWLAYKTNLVSGDVGNQMLMGIEHMIDLATFSKRTGKSVVGLLSDEDVTKYAQALRSSGMKVTADNIRSLNWIRKLSNQLDPASRKLVADYMQELSDLRKKILDMYPEGSKERVKAEEQLKISVATMSGLGWMDAAAKMANGKIRMGKIASLDSINETVAMQALHDDTILRGNRAISDWKKTLEGITDPDNRAEITRYIEMLQEGLANSKKSLIENSQETSKKVREVKKIMLADTFEGVDSSTIAKLDEIELDMAMRINPEAEELAERNRIAKDTLELLAERSESLSHMHGSLRTTNQIVRTFENITDVVWENAKQYARRGFVELDKMAENEKRVVDVSDMVKTMFKMARDSKQDNTTALSDFFSRDSKFFGGGLGKRARKAFNQMAYRALKDMTPTTYNKLKALHSTPGTDYYIDLQGREVTPLDIAMWYQDRGQLGAFNALPGEVLDVESAFREYAYRVGDKGLAALYTNFSKDIEKIVEKQVPEYFKQWKKAKTIMKNEWFDRLRIDGPINKLQNSKTGVKSNRVVTDSGNDRVDLSDMKIGDQVRTDSIDVTTELSSSTYKGNVSPATILKGLSKKIDKAFAGRRDGDGTLIDVIELQEEFNKIMSELSGRSSRNGQPVFDASDEVQMKALEAVSTLLETYVYDVWGRRAQNQLKTVDEVTSGRLPGSELGAIDLDLISEVQNALKFAMEMPDGNTRIFSPVNLDRILLTNNSIIDEVARNNKAANAVVEGRKALEAVIDDVVNSAKEKSKIISKGEEAVNKAYYSVEKSGVKFIEQFVNTGTPETLRTLREQALKNMVGIENFNNGKFLIKIDGIEYDARDVISEGIANLTANGLLEMAGFGSISGKPLTGFVGDEQTIKMAFSPQELVALFEGKNGKTFKANLIEVFSRGDASDAGAVKKATEHVETLEAIGRFLNITQKSDISSFKPQLTNIFKSPGVNWFMSRGFNLKRGQVSTPYVMGELAVAIATSAGIDLMKMAATDMDAAPYMLRLMQYPKSMTKRDMSLISSSTMDFVQSEMARLGMNIIDYIPEGTTQDVQDQFLNMLTSEEDD